MKDPFELLQSSDEPMSRVTEAAPGNTSPARQPREAQPANVVCPFCGQSKAVSAEPCPRCTMEDTPATRQATKARIGPWYVLQNRSPSAPGMRFGTLLWLVSKGHVTPRSVVRGPTTYQLWRYGAHVRGLSREWGLCYSCAGSIDRSATICVHCERPQEPPADPDTLLDVRVARPPRQPVMREIETPADSRPPREHLIVREPEAPAPAEPAIEISHAERLRQRQKMLVRQQAEQQDRRAGDPAFVSGMNLAAALRGPEQTETRSRRASVLSVALFLFVLIGGAAAAVLYLKPEYRAPTEAWVRGAWGTIREKMAAIRFSAPPGVEPPAVARQATPQPQPAPLVANPPAQSESLATQHPAKPEPKAQLAGDSGLSTDPRPPKKSKSDEPAQPAATPVEQPKSIERAIEEARTLWGQAIDAEARQDFAAAVRCYEQIKQLPQGAWPGGLQVSLDLARKRAAQEEAR